MGTTTDKISGKNIGKITYTGEIVVVARKCDRGGFDDTINNDQPSLYKLGNNPFSK